MFFFFGKINPYQHVVQRERAHRPPDEAAGALRAEDDGGRVEAVARDGRGRGRGVARILLGDWG